MPTRKKTRRNRQSIRGGTIRRSAGEKVKNIGKKVKNIGKKLGERFSQMTRRQRPSDNDWFRKHEEQQSQSKKTYKAERNSQSKGCPNESLTIGRMVSSTDGNIYFISEIDSEAIKLHDGKNIVAKQVIKEDKQNIKPYNYHDILGEIHILLDIIISKKYLNLDDNAKKDKYLDIINHIQSIVNNIKKIDVYSSQQALPLANAIPFKMPKAEIAEAIRNSQRGGSCIEEQPGSGRLVQHNHDFYYVSLDGKQMTNKKGSIDIPTDVSPYNYDEVLSSLLSLFKIILEKKYLYDNNHDNNHIDKMNIIKTIIDDIINIHKTEQTIDANPNNNKIYNLNNIVSDTESVKNPLFKNGNQPLNENVNSSPNGNNLFTLLNKMNADNHTNLTKRASSNSKRRAPRNLKGRYINDKNLNRS